MKEKHAEGEHFKAAEEKQEAIATSAESGLHNPSIEIQQSADARIPEEGKDLLKNE